MKSMLCWLAAIGLSVSLAAAQETNPPGKKRPTLPDDRGAPRVADLAPPLVLRSLDGDLEFDLQSVRSQKPVVLIFGSYT